MFLRCLFLQLLRRAHLDKKAIEQDLHHYEESPPKCIGDFSKQGNSILGILAIHKDALPEKERRDAVKFLFGSASRL